MENIDETPPSEVMSEPQKSVIEKYYYQFDNSDLNEFGYVQIDKKKIVVFYPAKLDNEYYLNEKTGHNVYFYVDKKLIFDYSWLPICTNADLIKCKDMLYKCYNELLKHGSCFFNTSNCHCNWYEHLVTTFDNKCYFLSSFENKIQTNIELEIKQNEIDTPQEIIHFQIFLGNNLLFCSKEILQMYKPETVNFIITFILNKLLKY
jgi:hypothetical protein